ncbi:unnamed protein product, partial [Aureobasidium pullulans]
AQKEYKPPLIANENAFLGDVYSSDQTNPEHPISCGFYRLEKGTPLVYTYTYDEMKIIVEGSTITFTTEDYGLAFYTGARKEGAA